MTILFDGRFESPALGLQNLSKYNAMCSDPATGLTIGNPWLSLSGRPNGVAGRIDLVSDPAGSGERVVRTAVYDTDDTAPVHNSLASGNRTELRIDGATYSAVPGTFWYWRAIYVPATFWADDPRPKSVQKFIIAQFHDLMTAPRSGGGWPNWWMTVDAYGRIDMQNTYSTNASLAADPGTTRYLIGYGGKSLLCPYGAWFEIVHKVTWSCVNGVGAWDIWIDHRKIFTESGHINSYNDSGVGPFMTQGVYDYTHGGSGPFGSRTAYGKGFVVGDSADATYNEFMDTCGWPLKRELELTSGRVSM